MIEVFMAAFAVAALAWFVWRRLRYVWRLRSMSDLFVAPPRLAVGLGRKVTAAEVRWMFRNQSGVCNNPFCRANLKTTRYEVDHIVPKSRGGPDGVGNAQLLCRDCNQMKCAQPWPVFLVSYQDRRASAKMMGKQARFVVIGAALIGMITLELGYIIAMRAIH
jgi:hypothetical protein